jgi:hypothetical protein
MLIGFILIIVEIKFTAPRIDDTPAKWREKIAKSTEAPTFDLEFFLPISSSFICLLPN